MDTQSYSNNHHDVFVSYSSKNKNYADAIVADLEQHGVKCWYAPRDILPGETWIGAINAAIKSTTVFILVYTDDSNKSKQVANEVTLAFNAEKTIIPFRLSSSDMNDELEYYLLRVHWLDAVTPPLSNSIAMLRDKILLLLSHGAEGTGFKGTAEPAAESAGIPAIDGDPSGKEGITFSPAGDSSGNNGRSKFILPAVIAAALIVVGFIMFSLGSHRGSSGSSAPAEQGGVTVRDDSGGKADNVDQADAVDQAGQADAADIADQTGQEDVSAQAEQDNPAGQESRIYDTGKAGVTASASLSADKLHSWADHSTVQKVVFHNTLDNAPSDAGDLSEDGSGSVLAWMDGSTLNIAGDGGVKAPVSCQNLFSDKDAATDPSRRWNRLEAIEGGQYFDTSDVTNMFAMFWYCQSLRSVDVSSWDTSRVTSMALMFNNCTNLEELDTSGWDTSFVTSMSSMFSGCAGLRTLNTSGWNTSRVSDTHYMFSGCSGLDELDVSGWDTSRFEDMSYMFYGCSGLDGLDVSGWDTGRVSNMHSAFYQCTGLEELDVSGWKTPRLTNTYSMFKECFVLTSLDMSGWDVSRVTDARSMFYDCGSLGELNISGWNLSRINSTGFMFGKCGSLTELDVSGWDTSGVSEFDYTFYGCGSVEQLDVSGWDTSGATSMKSMFSGCRSLTSLDVSGWDTSNVTDMNSMFMNCESLTSLDVSGWDLSNVTDSDKMFKGTILE